MAYTTQIIVKQGWLGAIVLLALFVLCIFFNMDMGTLIFFVGLVFWLFMFRNPERIPQTDERNIFVSPVDGIVRDIQKQDSEVIILIETRSIDVGVIRAPCEIIEGEKGEKKGLALAFCNKNKKATLNAMMSFTHKQDFKFRMEFYPVLFSSHKIYADSNLNIGERMGFMKMGITKLIIPQNKNTPELELKINIGDRLYALGSPIGHINEI
ncbi:phosphatidylserine decarboxylase [Helicobacter sp. MIT 05-5293]|uniref:phosphatidylserine decarboxylase n=1 Tax=Helicobacter sp. MIT 05-5293 TaxID=1548149 RepID=UPI00051DDBEE|nr:phosphatidylserine decarboxylase [Helicobacter sp. MIT 05-5293]TLD81630.1 phosphatidylserine decarboxylase [Helicobacter sp. MIT 05-5293]